MAHSQQIKAALRAAYIFERLPIDTAARKLKVPAATALRWKRAAKTAGDDWDKARAASALADQNFGGMAQQLLHDYLLQHQATIDLLKAATDIGAQEKADTLASLADSFNKTMAAFRRVSPEISRHAVALDVLAALADFIKTRHPEHLPAFTRILEPFGAQLSEVLG